MDGFLIGWWRGEAGGVDREEEREEGGGENLAKAVEGEDGVVGAVGRRSLGLERSEFGEGGVEEAELDKDVFGLMMEGPAFLVAMSL